MSALLIQSFVAYSSSSVKPVTVTRLCALAGNGRAKFRVACSGDFKAKNKPQRQYPQYERWFLYCGCCCHGRFFASQVLQLANRMAAPVEIEDQMVQLELDFDAKEDELKMTRNKLANTRMKLNRSRSARVILNLEVLQLKADVQVWRDRATETMLAFGKSSEIFANLTKTLAPTTSQSSSR